jgi:hypothetical protein
MHLLQATLQPSRASDYDQQALIRIGITCERFEARSQKKHGKGPETAGDVPLASSRAYATATSRPNIVALESFSRVSNWP